MQGRKGGKNEGRKEENKINNYINKYINKVKLNWDSESNLRKVSLLSYSL
jgi:hypothetical protein